MHTIALNTYKATFAVDDADDDGAFFSQIVAGSGAHIAPALHNHALAVQGFVAGGIIVAHGLAHAIARNEIGDQIAAFRFGVIGSAGHYLAHACTQLANLLPFDLGSGGKVAHQHAFLWVFQAIHLCDGDHFVHLVHVQVSTGAVIGFEQGQHRFKTSA